MKHVLEGNSLFASFRAISGILALTPVSGWRAVYATPYGAGKPEAVVKRL
jgi:hypothetical protein